jgi:hypothetical protein
MKKRVIYAIAALALLGAEACIALFVHVNFVRPFLGDVLAVLLFHCAVRVILPGKPRLLAVYVFLFACAIEAAQHIRLLDLLGLGDMQLLRVIIGGTFDWRDILCYAAGCAAAGAGEALDRH